MEVGHKLKYFTLMPKEKIELQELLFLSVKVKKCY